MTAKVMCGLYSILPTYKNEKIHIDIDHLSKCKKRALMITLSSIQNRKREI